MAVGVSLVLLALLAVAQVAHVHANETDADHCQLCIVMHSLVPIAPLAAAVVMVTVGMFLTQAEPAAVICQRQFRLFTRPPPVSC